MSHESLPILQRYGMGILYVLPKFPYNNDHPTDGVTSHTIIEFVSHIPLELISIISMDVFSKEIDEFGLIVSFGYISKSASGLSDTLIGTTAAIDDDGQ